MLQCIVKDAIRGAITYVVCKEKRSWSIQKRKQSSNKGAESMRYLTFALTKGRLAKKTLEMLERLGITCEEMKDKDSRKLIL